MRTSTGFLALSGYVLCVLACGAPQEPEGTRTSGTSGASGTGAGAAGASAGKGGTGGASGGSGGGTAGAAGTTGGAGGTSGTGGAAAAGGAGGAAGAAGMAGASGASGATGGKAGTAGAGGGTGGNAGTAGAGAAGTAGTAGAGTAGAGAAGTAGAGTAGTAGTGVGGATAGAAGDASAGIGGATTGGAAGAAGEGGMTAGAGGTGTGGGSGTGVGGAAGGEVGYVAVPAPGGGAYAIGATEVTNVDYAMWAATKPSILGQPPECAWNDDFASRNDSLETPPWWPSPPTDVASLPVVNVDWCDAMAYCKAYGKRLCGKIGGGALAYDAEPGDPTKSQWLNACSAQGTTTYPYGQSYVPSACTTDPAPAPTPVAAKPLCTSTEPGFGGIYDLSGNVWEWEDACQPANGGSDAQCRVRGGAFDNGASEVTCNNLAFSFSREYRNPFTGFRCCSD